MAGAMILGWGGKIPNRRLDPNHEHIRLPDGAVLQWTIIEADREILEILGDGEMDTRLQLLARPSLNICEINVLYKIDCV